MTGFKQTFGIHSVFINNPWYNRCSCAARAADYRERAGEIFLLMRLIRYMLTIDSSQSSD